MSTKLVLFGVFFSLSSKFRPGLRPGLGQVYYQNSAPFWGKRVHIGNCDPFVRQELSQPRTDCLLWSMHRNRTACLDPHVL